MVKNLDGKRPDSDHCVRNAVARVEAAGSKRLPTTRYKNSGRRYGSDGGKYLLTPKQQKSVVAFVKQWRHKRFCTCGYIKREMKLEATPRTIARVLNRHDYHWRQVAKKSPLSKKQLRQRKEWVNKLIDKDEQWWRQNMHLIFDGVTLTKAPQSLDSRQKHAAQSIRHMWMKKKEAMDPALHTFNRYGVQLGTKVPLWGGFTGDGKFSLKLWTDRPKMKMEEWAQHVSKLKKAASQHSQSKRCKKLKLWHDNEKFLQQPKEYKKAGLVSINFPPNSGDLNPIETVWAKLRKDLAAREFEDLKADKVISIVAFKQRVSQLLTSYSTAGPGEKHSYLEKLVQGMPKRMKQCKNNKYGPCGKYSLFRYKPTWHRHVNSIRSVEGLLSSVLEKRRQRKQTQHKEDRGATGTPTREKR